MSSRLSEREIRLARVLNDGYDLFEAIQGERTRTAASNNRYTEALTALREMAEEENIPIAIIGGLATVYHGHERFTKDIDISVSIKDFERIVKVCYKYGFDIKSFNPTGFHELEYKGIPIEVLQEGAFGHQDTDPESMPDPSHMGVGKGLGFASLESWVRLKLAARRRKDETDVVEVLKNKTPEEIKRIGDYLKSVSFDYFTKFMSLANEAESEKKRSASFWGVPNS